MKEVNWYERVFYGTAYNLHGRLFYHNIDMLYLKGYNGAVTKKSYILLEVSSKYDGISRTGRQFERSKNDM